MASVTRRTDGAQALSSGLKPGVHASANGGVVLLAQAWAALGGSAVLTKGLRWQSFGGTLMLFALVVLPLFEAHSLLAVASAVVLTDPLYRVLEWGKVMTQRRLDRFATSDRHDWMEVYRNVLGQLVRHPATARDAREPAALGVDSFVVEKRYGPKMSGIRPVYDPVQKKLVDGYEITSAAVISGTQNYPVGLLPHRKPDDAEQRAKQKRRRRKARAGELPSKLDQALMLVNVAIAAGVGIAGLTVVGDSAFGAMWWLREIMGLGLPWLVSTRNDRRLRIGAAVKPFVVWVRQMTLTSFDVDEHGAGIWAAQLPQATLLDKGCRQKGIECSPAYFERRDRNGKVIHRWYLVTSHLDWGLATIWQHWGWRWSIDVWHRVWKQQLAVTQFHVRTWKGIETLFACTSLRASLIAFVKAIEPTYHNLSIETFVINLRKMGCLIETGINMKAVVTCPEVLPPEVLWKVHTTPIPIEYWPIRLKAA